MKIVTFGLLLAAFSSCGPGVKAQTAKENCEALRENHLESYPDFGPSCECVAGSNDTYTLTCEDGCDSCDANQTCGLRSFSQVIDSQGGSAAYRQCFEFTTSSFKGDVICYQSTDGGLAAQASQQKKFSLRSGRDHSSAPAFLHGRRERTALHHKIGQERAEEQCHLSVNGENCTSCENRFTECGLKGEGSYLYADCTNNEIDSIVDACRSEGFDGILLPFFTAYYRGTCKNGTVEPDNTLAATYCKQFAADNEEFFSDFQRTCECIPNDNGTYTLSCEENCQSCNEGKACGFYSYTELVDPFGMSFESTGCFEHVEGDFEGDKVCVETVFMQDEEKCSISVNGNECNSCEFLSQSCGLLGYYTGLHADCTNVVEINGMVDECHNDGFESGGVLLPFFTSLDVGMCSGDGNATNSTTSESLAEDMCKEMMGWFNESETKTTCECIAGSDNTTFTLSCQDWCEMCDPDSNICGIYSFTELFDPEGGDSAYADCFEYTQGPFKGDKVCTELTDTNGTKACRISANGVDCSSCEYQDKMCGQQGYGLFFTANCNNVDDIEVIVDECSGAGLGSDDILGAYYNAFEVGNCNITEQVEETDAKTEPPEEEVTSGAKSDSQMVVSSIVVAALLFSSLT